VEKHLPTNLLTLGGCRPSSRRPDYGFVLLSKHTDRVAAAAIVRRWTVGMARGHLWGCAGAMRVYCGASDSIDQTRSRAWIIMKQRRGEHIGRDRADRDDRGGGTERAQRTKCGGDVEAQGRRGGCAMDRLLITPTQSIDFGRPQSDGCGDRRCLIRHCHVGLLRTERDAAHVQRRCVRRGWIKEHVPET